MRRKRLRIKNRVKASIDNSDGLSFFYDFYIVWCLGEYNSPNRRSKMANLFYSIARKIEEKILSEEILPGTRLESERQLAAIYGVSRNVIRESLRVLEEKGLVKTQIGKGTYAQAQTRKEANQVVSEAIIHTNTKWTDIIEIREVIEIAAIRKAVSEATQADLNQLKNILNRMKKIKPNGIANNMKFSELDTEFHLQIAKASKNEMFYLLLRSFYNITEYREVFWLSQLYPNGQELALAQHCEIYDVIVSRNENKSIEALTKHIRTLRSEMTNVVTKQEL